ncbi:hypothetical protein ACJX0J_037052, partial [Zea mays]
NGVGVEVCVHGLPQQVHSGNEQDLFLGHIINRDGLVVDPKKVALGYVNYPTHDLELAAVALFVWVEAAKMAGIHYHPGKANVNEKGDSRAEHQRPTRLLQSLPPIILDEALGTHLKTNQILEDMLRACALQNKFRQDILFKGD